MDGRRRDRDRKRNNPKQRQAGRRNSTRTDNRRGQKGYEGVVDRQRGSQRRKRLRNGGQGEALASSWMNADGQVDTARHIPKQRLGTDTLAQRDRASPAEAERHMEGQVATGRESQIQAEEQTDLGTAVGQVQGEARPGHQRLTSDRQPSRERTLDRSAENPGKETSRA